MMKFSEIKKLDINVNNCKINGEGGKNQLRFSKLKAQQFSNVFWREKMKEKI